VNIRLTVAAGVATVLASIALYPLLAGGGWFWGGIGAAIVIGGIGVATRRRPLPAAACLLAAVGGEFLYLNAVFAHRQSLAGVVPTWSSVRYLRLLVTQATAEAHPAPPVPARPGIVLVTVAGIGLVAALTDVLAVRLHRPAIAGLPLLVLFCVPLTTKVKPGAMGAALVFCAGVAGYLGLLSADGRYRLRLWGRVVHPWKGDVESADPDVRPVAAASRRIGFVAVVLALFLPLLVPAAEPARAARDLPLPPLSPGHWSCSTPICTRADRCRFSLTALPARGRHRTSSYTCCLCSPPASGEWCQPPAPGHWAAGEQCRPHRDWPRARQASV